MLVYANRSTADGAPPIPPIRSYWEGEGKASVFRKGREDNLTDKMGGAWPFDEESMGKSLGGVNQQPFFNQVFAAAVGPPSRWGGGGCQKEGPARC